jgi:hypothetical protein
MLQSMQVKILLYFRYMRMNVAASDQHKQYDASVPRFLHNRPDCWAALYIVPVIDTFCVNNAQ